MNIETNQPQSKLEKWAAYFKKYRALLLSILVFIILDLSILIFNFYISTQIANNAAIINVAAKQEVLSQKISKNLLAFERAYNKSIPYDNILNDINASIRDFDLSLSAFDKGGQLLFVDGRSLNIDAVNDDVGRQAIDAAKPMWLIYKNYTNSVLNEFNGTARQEESLVTIFSREYLIKSVVGYTASNNINLLHVMERLTGALERTAAQKTRQLRGIQLLGIVLAVINFLHIMFYSLKKIQRKDQALADAKKEVEIMLNAITEGVVLIDSSLIIREHYSTEMEKIFNRTDFVGQSLIDLLHNANCGEDKETIRRYAMQWFDMANNVDSLVQKNPLAEVQIYNVGKNIPHYGKKHLTISFSRVYQHQGGVGFLLVRFNDVTDRVEKYMSVIDERAGQEKQLDIASALLDVNIDSLPDFFNFGFRSLDHMRARLTANNGEMINVCESMLEILKPFKEQCQDYRFSSLLIHIQGLESAVRKSMLSGDDPKTREHNLPIAIDKFAAELELTYNFVSRVVGTRWPQSRSQTAAVSAQ